MVGERCSSPAHLCSDVQTLAFARQAVPNPALWLGARLILDTAHDIALR